MTLKQLQDQADALKVANEAAISVVKQAIQDHRESQTFTYAELSDAFVECFSDSDPCGPPGMYWHRVTEMMDCVIHKREGTNV